MVGRNVFFVLLVIYYENNEKLDCMGLNAKAQFPIKIVKNQIVFIQTYSISNPSTSF